MKRTVDHGAMSVVGYTVPWHATAGQEISLHASSAAEIRRARICRLDTPEPTFPGWAVESRITDLKPREFEQGSFLKISASELRRADTIEGISFELFLTCNPDARTIVDVGNWRLCCDGGRLVFRQESRTHETGVVVPDRCWLTVRIFREGDAVTVHARGHDALRPYEVSHAMSDLRWEIGTEALLFGVADNAAELSLNARFAALRLETAAGAIEWKFPTRLPAEPFVASSGKLPLLLELVNRPTMCATSRRWDGSCFDPRLVPDHYDAVHCHDDDMAGLDWPITHRATIPADAQPGIYAFELGHDLGEERIVFFISAAHKSAPLLFLVPTATYLAYADEFLPPHLFEWKCEDRGQRFAVDNNLRSLYDYHTDTSGVSICSYRKPKATLRDDYLYPLCGCPHNLPVDLNLLRFCHINDIAFDLITDHQLHHEVADCLSGYSAVMTGSHPEYMSVEMEEALRGFVANGGSIAYLGGNGFAGTVAFQDDLMELRRSPLEAGRTWDGVVAEQVLSITNEPGGYLRNRGRGEFSLVGGAISLMGFDGARPFTRTEESFEPDCAWLFEDVQEDTFGREGMVLGGAAGYEVDSTDPHLGTSPDTIIVARADGFPASFYQDATRWYEGGEPEMASRRVAEMTLRRLSSGGVIFSASSVAWCGALPADGSMNDVGRITRNLLKRLSSMTGAVATLTDKPQPEGK
jgi:N,N-dimethylformamidase